MSKIEIEDGQTHFTSVLAVRMPPSMREQVDQAARSAMMSQACWARQLIMNALKGRDAA